MQVVCSYMRTTADRERAIATLVQYGVDLDERDLDGCTALMRAAKTNFTEGVELLLKYGAKINSQDPLGRTALHWAALSNAGKSLKVLVSSGTDLEVRDHAGMTALLQSARNGKFPLMKALLDAGADRFAVNNYGMGVVECSSASDIPANLDAYVRKQQLRAEKTARPATKSAGRAAP